MSLRMHFNVVVVGRILALDGIQIVTAAAIAKIGACLSSTPGSGTTISAGVVIR